MSQTDDDSQELLAVIASSGSNHSKDNLSNLNKNSEDGENLINLANVQEFKTKTVFGRIKEFIKINFLGYNNEFEKYILNNEPNDCSLIAKYYKTIDIDLRNQPNLSIDSVTLSSIHIPHPLVSFTRNEANQSTDENITKELQESPIIVFIHGLGGQMSQFEPLMGLLSQCSEIFSIDLPGFGNSKIDFNKNKKYISPISKEDQIKISSSIKKMNWDDFKTENIVNIVYEFIMQKIPKNKTIVLIGHSMGTHISIKLAKKLPNSKVEGLILLSPPEILDDTKPTVEITKSSRSLTKSLAFLKFFTYFPFLFDYFRVWDRLPGLKSHSVTRQLSKTNNRFYNSLRQFRWNLDVNSTISLRYVNGFQKATTTELITAIKKFNDNPLDKHVYEKTLLICGSNDQLTGVSSIYKAHEFLTKTFNKKVSSIIEVKDVGHSLLLVKPEFISGMILNHIESKFPERLHLSPAWVLKIKALISGDKWGLKNELKWSNLKPISSNITRNNGKDIAPLLGMKTLREEDTVHSPTIVESLFYDTNSNNTDIKGNLIAIIDISADIPPYSPKSFKTIKYYKCATVSKVVPDQSSIRRFIQLIDDILVNNIVENPLIGVHCHYGFNRTGFLICCYLIENLGWSVEEAVEGFKIAKSPGIKHPHFIDALYVRYDK
ncbi:uncharacterized protein KGF55_000851 [Candida pseudojiufengensis]|uniref:uncharacterized protein n=1 Tax=Candida pseudojiufengensis TaxID=497109 RepID=UPI002224BA04|nr:uncharacterized protein KGF55_000851 [Candida pseudojiufengensis]KAI5966542.1 hypothetical protein KGF55_000851 [Candida pseudojiufengensis]